MCLLLTTPRAPPSRVPPSGCKVPSRWCKRPRACLRLVARRNARYTTTTTHPPTTPPHTAPSPPTLWPPPRRPTLVSPRPCPSTSTPSTATLTPSSDSRGRRVRCRQGLPACSACSRRRPAQPKGAWLERQGWSWLRGRRLQGQAYPLEGSRSAGGSDRRTARPGLPSAAPLPVPASSCCCRPLSGRACRRLAACMTGHGPRNRLPRPAGAAPACSLQSGPAPRQAQCAAWCSSRRASGCLWAQHP